MPKTHNYLSSVTAIVIAVCALTGNATAQTSTQPEIRWQDGPTIGKLGDIAEISIPKGYRFTDKVGAQRVLELTQNIPTGRELGAIIPAVHGRGELWFMIFEFRETGLVKDDEKDSLDVPAILKALQEGTEKQNKVRREKGWPSYHVAGWERRPYYDPNSHNLTWSIRGRDDKGGESINHSIRVLGRRGTMNVDLVASPDEYAAALPDFDQLVGGFTYKQGNRYADFVKGDKVAAYGLTALIAGGAGAALVKTGLLSKIWKLLVLAVAAIIAAFRKLFARLLGRRSENEVDAVSRG